MLNTSLIEHLQQRFTDFFSSHTTIHYSEAVQGGDINQAFMVDTSKGRFFVKLNAAMFGLDMFEKEARGLIYLADTGALKVPRPLFDGKFHQQIFLVIEFVDHGEPAGDFWEDFGEGMAKLHYNSHELFGFAYNNFIGRFPQSNAQHASWSGFYAAERILPLTIKANEKGLLEKEHVEAAESICGRLEDIFPGERPALLHGDLWNGNFICGANGHVAIFDPAVYYGNREMDMGMSLLFGGFDQKFYASYQYHFPLAAGWKKRAELCQLYPLLVHLLLFGGHYRRQVMDVLKKYS
ncbi:MAG: fructosamine kinase family protein [Chitinophagaceae bacterium]|nr:fructosamine kinase family protein [Chitinophagaceae bacterium]